MTRRRSGGIFLLCLLSLAGLLATTACDDLFLGISGGYTGPQPAREALTNETAIVRQARPSNDGQIVLILDRIRFTEANEPHDVNRVIKAWTSGDNQDSVAALSLAPGDRVVVSTAFSSVDETAGSLGVPNWPGHKAMEYPIGSHRIVEIARSAP